MREFLNTLYVQTQGSYLRLEGETVVVEVDRAERAKLPLHHLGAIVMFGNIMVSPFLLARCADDGRGVTWLSTVGRFQARLEGPRSGNVLLRRAQHRAADRPDQALALARESVAGKLQNARLYLLRAARDASESAADALRVAAGRLERHLHDAAIAADLDALRGEEGAAAAEYFSCFPHIVRVADPTFAWTGRTRRPPLDPMNALLSFLYALLTNDCVAAVEAAGLDPQIGFLHALRPGRPSLALDLMEEFRPLLADRVAFALVNRRQVSETDFVRRPGGAVEMTEAGRRTILTAYQKRKQDEVTHPLLAEQMPLGLAPLIQARVLARAVRGDLARYTAFVPR
ncbi:MAG TPA: type I-C CRISPR-associated endonuclease Cas1c [Acetobacteraceae bacterium]|nr:type I-C CRISPR-associated endonuclease Cas1c [Acetobacteraceae bacterium]